ncbi:MAG: CtsR family transcriptional regulator [Syntrophomonadaceae bacterium]|nr:CtsR family transcriptional regulator [Syntrophomonadaceae bacterium]
MKKSLADKIEQYIKVLIARSESDQIEIQRAELAETFSCVPSQVTYVLATRFTERDGYVTISRRGGKGYVRITRCEDTASLREFTELCGFIDELLAYKAISQVEKDLLIYLITNAFKYFNHQQKGQIYDGIKQAISDYVNLHE